MAKTAILKVKIISDGRDAAGGFRSAETGLERFQRRVDQASKVAVVAGGAVVGLGAKALSAASDLQQSTGAVDAVFKGQAAAVHQLGENAARAVGLSNSAYQQTAAVLGAQLKNLGVSSDQLAGQTDDLIRLGADLSAQFGGTTQQAVEALSAAFRGERDPIEKYGVSIKQTQINAWLAEHGLSGLEGQAKSNAEAQATLALITEQTADAQGAFARETDTVAHQQQVARASYDDAMASLGNGLLPIMARVAEVAAGLALAAGSHPQLFANIAIAVAGTAGAVLALNFALRAYRAVMVLVGLTKAVWTGLTAAAYAYATGQAAANATGAAATLGTWIGTHARMAVLWTATKLAAIGSMIATATSATIQAGATALAWTLAQARMAGGWVLMQIRAVASFVMIAGQAVLQAGIMALAWITSNARAAASFLLMRGAQLAAVVATGAMTAAQWALNVALNANPIGLVIIAVVALVAGFVALYTKCEGFRNAVNVLRDGAVAAFNGIRAAVGWVIDKIVALWNKSEGVRGVMVTAFRAALNPINTMKNAISSVINAVSRLIGWIGRIRFPKPPSWLHFAAGAGEAPAMLTGGLLTAAAGPVNASAFSVPRVDAGPLAAGAGVMPETNVTNNYINIDGALDPVAVANQIRDVLGDVDVSRGSVRAASVGRRNLNW